jgi:hypothetical protein
MPTGNAQSCRLCLGSNLGAAARGKNGAGCGSVIEIKWIKTARHKVMYRDEAKID